jgi:hypothetical protein
MLGSAAGSAELMVAEMPYHPIILLAILPSVIATLNNPDPPLQSTLISGQLNTQDESHTARPPISRENPWHPFPWQSPFLLRNIS